MRPDPFTIIAAVVVAVNVIGLVAFAVDNWRSMKDRLNR